MRINAASALAITAIAVGGASGCAATQSVPDNSTVDAQLRGVGDVKFVQARCRLTLTNSAGNRVHLNGVLVASGAEYLRIRTWKFTRPVVDIALTPHGLWVAIGTVVNAADRAELETSARDIGNAWSMIASDSATWGQPLDQIDHDDTDARYITMPRADGTQVLTVVDRSSRTPVRHELRDASGKVLRTLSLEQYQNIDQFAWPHRMILQSPQGTIVISMSSVQLNGESASNSFAPPDGARRLE
jgi:hypothetical protein